MQGGQRIVGQLGHGDTAAYRTPKKVEAFEGVGVIQAECGEDFTVSVTGTKLFDFYDHRVQLFSERFMWFCSRTDKEGVW